MTAGQSSRSITEPMQFVVQVPVLKRFGMRWNWNWNASRTTIQRIMRQLIPMAVGLAILPINTLVDTVVAWVFSAQKTDIVIPWIGEKSVYPLEEGTVAAIYFAERLYQFPVGLLGVVIGVVAFPALSRHANSGDRKQFVGKIIQALRANLFFAIPATAGLILLSEPLTSLLFRHGAFTETDTLRTAQMVAAYACGIWAYSTLPILIRGFYASEDSKTPFHLGIAVVVFNGFADLTCIWLLGETGLAYASAVAAALFSLLLIRKAHLQWQLFSEGMLRGEEAFWKNPLMITLLRSIVATAIMYTGGYLLLEQISDTETASLTNDFFDVSILFVSCVMIYLLVSLLLGAREWQEQSA